MQSFLKKRLNEYGYEMYIVLKLDSEKEINDNDTIMGCGGKKRQPAQKV